MEEQGYDYNVLEENLVDEKDFDLYDKWQDLNYIYGDYVLYHCNRCGYDGFVFNLEDDKSCHNCNGTKEDIELIDNNENYKQLYLEGIVSENECDARYCCCNNCKETQKIWEYIVNDLKCIKCNKSGITLLKQNEYGDMVGIGTYEDEEQEYTCENCFGDFTSNLTQNIKCPHCGYVHESLEPIDPEDREPDLQINDEDWEDL